jgi:hypothetical protein
MPATEMTEKINYHRRRFLGAAAMTLAPGLVMICSAEAQSSKTKPTQLPRSGLERIRRSAY